MKKLILILLSLFNIQAIAQPNLVWNNKFSIPGLNIELHSATIDHNSRLIVAGHYQPDPLFSSNDYEPIVLVYDAAGNLVLNWTHADSLNSEGVPQVAVDDSNNIYIATAGTTSFLVKLDAVTFSEQFRLPFTSGFLPNKFLIHDSKIYYFQLNPFNNLKTIDLQGNLLFANAIPYLFRLHAAIATDNFLYIAGDTINGNNFRLRFLRLSLSTPTAVLNSYTTNLPQIEFGDAIVNAKEEFYFGGWSSTQSHLIKLDSLFSFHDTLLQASAYKYDFERNLNNDVYLAFNSGSNTILNQIYPVSGFIASEDSAYSNSPGQVNLAIDSNNEKYIFRSKKKSIIDYVFEIYSIGSNGTVNWHYDFQVDSSRSLAYKMFYRGNSIFCVGTSYYPGSPAERSVITFRLSNVTGVAPIEMGSNVLIYPNPITTGVALKFDYRVTHQPAIFSLNDLTGRTVFEFTLSPETEHHEINLPLLQAGLYLVQIRSGSRISASKVIVE